MVFEDETFYPIALLTSACLPETIMVILHHSQYRQHIAFENSSKSFYLTDSLPTSSPVLRLSEEVPLP